MKKKAFFLLALLLTAWQVAWAQTEVRTETALRNAISGNSSVKLTTNITLNNRLIIENGKNITIDLNGNKLSRSLKSATAEGNVIYVETGATLTVKDGGSNGQIAGGKAVNGGGICNHGTLILESGSITECAATDCGGGIFNAPITAGGTPATLTIKGGQVVANSCGDRGAGIYNYPNSTVNIQGEVFIHENIKQGEQNNLYLDGESVINVTGALTNSMIGVSILQVCRTVTSGYKTNNPSADGSAFFRSDNNSFDIAQTGDEMAIGKTVTFNVRSWDNTNNLVTTESVTRECTILEGSHPNEWIGLTNGYYAVKNNVSYKALNILGNDVHLILEDGATLQCAHIKLEEGQTLHIHSQSDGNQQGKLEAINRKKSSKPDTDYEGVFEDAATIGGGNEKSMGSLFIHGGDIFAQGAESKSYVNCNSGAAIGGGYRGGIGLNSQLVIYGGKVSAYATLLGAGIGSGYKASQGGPIMIYGGSVKAEGAGFGAAIGGGYEGNGGVVKIYGGRVEANMYNPLSLLRGGAGIGAGEKSSEGGKVYIYGGETYAKGGSNAAGIGGDNTGRGGTLEVYGGYLFAAGDHAPAIGGGRTGDGGTVIINGGTVCAVKDIGNVATIGGGLDNNGNGALDIGIGLSVWWGNDADAVTNPDIRESSHLKLVEFVDWRREACQNRNHYCVLIQPCPHVTRRTHTYIDKNTHGAVCKQCGHYYVENHVFVEDVCECGTKYNESDYYYTLNIHKTADGTTYTDDVQKVVQGKEFTLPVPQSLNGLTFMGYLKTESADGIEMKDGEESSLLEGGKTITPDADATYYARYRYLYNQEWKWNEECTEATVKITNALLDDTQTLNATVTEDVSKRVEPTETTPGERYFNATASYTHHEGVTYTFSDQAIMQFFPDTDPLITLDTQSEDNANTQKLMNYFGMKADVTVNNLTLKKDNKVHPICLPFYVSKNENTPLKGAIIYELSSIQLNNHEFGMTFVHATGLKPGVPCFYRFEEAGADVVNPMFEDVIIEDCYGLVAEKKYNPSIWKVDDETLELWGTFEPEAIDEVNRELYFMMDGDGISLKPATLNAFGCYFYVASPTDEEDNNRVRSVSLAFEFDDEFHFSKKLTYSWDGNGSEDLPYIISSPEQLNEMQEAMNGADAAALEGKYFLQGDNITFEKSITNNYTPVNSFKANYDGNGYVIRGLNINTPAANAALFLNMADGSSARNVILADCSITGIAAGGIACQISGSAVVDNCHVLKNVSVATTLNNYIGDYSAGGIVAYMNGEGSPTVTNCTSHAAVSSENGHAGGIVGVMKKGSLTNCVYLGNESNLISKYNRKAIVADYTDGTVEDCYFTSATFSDEKAELMPEEDADNTDFLTLLMERDEFLKLEKTSLTASDINYDITLNGHTLYKDNDWNTLTLPFSMTAEQIAASPLADPTIEQLVSTSVLDAEGRLTLNFTGATTIAAGTPFLVKWASGDKVVNPVFTGVTIDKSENNVAFTGGEFKGNYAPFAINDDNRLDILLLTSDNRLAFAITDRTLGAFHAYFDINEAAQAGVRAFALNFGNGATSIVEVPDGGSVNEKGDDSYYDLSGRKLTGEPTENGIYIKNGKKILIIK